MKTIFFLFLFLLIGVNLFAGFENSIFTLIDNPTCGNYFRGQYEIRARLEPQGGILAGIYVGITDNFSIGISYGGDNIIGYGEIDGYETPGVEVRFRLVEETFIYPAFALGFSSQGYGPWVEEYSRYRIKSKGFYGVVSKNYDFIGNLSLHGGVNYSLERNDNKNPNLFLGFEKSIAGVYSFLVDYDLAYNEGIEEYKQNGYLNIGIKGYFAPYIAIEFDMRNLLKTGDDGVNRVLKLSYLDNF